MKHICLKLNKTPAAYYKHLKENGHTLLQTEVVRELTLEKRKYMPRLGGKKTYYEIKNDLKQHGIKMGRDKYFDWLRAEGMLIRPKKRFTRTTQSFHRFRTHRNQIQGLEIYKPDQVWVSDITYLRLQNGFCYLSLITDVFSRKIIGYQVSDNLGLEGPLSALEKACRNKSMTKTIHHSDRGFHYCSDKYIKKLSLANIDVSMGEVGNCYENAIAERVNGILKEEFNLDATFPEAKDARQIVDQAIYAYNHLRPHMAIKLKKPNQLYAA